MGDFPADKRDILFNLFDHHRLGDVLGKGAYADVNEDLVNMVIDAGLEFAEKTLAPLNIVLDRKGVGFDAGTVTTPEEHKAAFNLAREGGWLSITGNPKWGGQGMPHALATAVGEFFVGACGAFTMTGELTAGAANLVASFGAEELQTRYIPNMYTGQWTGTMCLTEPQAGSAVGDSRTTATPVGDGSYKIQGTKIFISSGDHDLAENIIHMVLARLPDAPPGTRGLSLFLVPKVRVNDDGSLGESNDVACGNVEHKMGIKGSPTCTMNFGENDNCLGWIVGEPGMGMPAMFQMMNEARIAVGLQGLAQASAAFGHAWRYCTERVQGTDIREFKNPEAERVTIIKHPDVRRMLMQQKVRIEAIRSLLIGASVMGDTAHSTDDEELRTRCEDTLALLTPVCKAFGSDQGFRCTEWALQCYGGYGYTVEYPAEQYMRDVKIASVYEGTNGIQALDLVGRKLRLKGGSVVMGYMMELNAWAEANSALPRTGAAIKRWEQTRDKLAETIMTFMSAGATNPLVPIAGATEFLNLMGHVVCAFELLKQSALSEGRLKELVEAKGVDPTDLKAVGKLAREDDDVRFYNNKIISAAFYANHVLPEADASAATILSGDMSILEADLEGLAL